MNNLIEHILNEDYVSAKEIFESRLDEIMARKIYEMKKIVQAEAFGGGAAGVAARKAAGFRKASDVLGDPYSNKKTFGAKPAKAKAQTPADEWKGMSFGQKKSVVKHVRGLVQKHLDANAPSTATKKPETVSHAAASSGAPEVKLHPSEIKGSGAQPAKATSPKTSSGEGDGVTSGMRRILRQRYRKTTGVTATNVAAKSLKNAVSPGTSLGGRVRAIKRAGKAIGTIKLGRGTIGSAVMGGLKGAESGLHSI